MILPELSWRDLGTWALHDRLEHSLRTWSLSSSGHVDTWNLSIHSIVERYSRAVVPTRRNGALVSALRSVCECVTRKVQTGKERSRCWSNVGNVHCSKPQGRTKVEWRETVPEWFYLRWSRSFERTDWLGFEHRREIYCCWTTAEESNQRLTCSQARDTRRRRKNTNLNKRDKLPKSESTCFSLFRSFFSSSIRAVVLRWQKPMIAFAHQATSITGDVHRNSTEVQSVVLIRADGSDVGIRQRTVIVRTVSNTGDDREVTEVLFFACDK